MKQKEPIASIIIPTFNRKGQIQEAIESVFSQTFRDYELIVIDDASEDGTADWIKQNYPGIQLIELSKNQGAAAARNAGMRVAQGQFIAFLDSDDRWLPDYLEKSIKTLEENPQAVLSACDCFVQSGQSQKVYQSKTWSIYSSPTHHMLMCPLILTMSIVVIRRIALEQSGLLNESLKICEDREFYLRLLRSGDLAYIPHPLAVKIQGTDNLTKNLRLYAREVFRVLNLFFSDPENAQYKSLEAEARSRWALNIAKISSELKTERILWLWMIFKAACYSPKMVLNSIRNRVL